MEMSLDDIFRGEFVPEVWTDLDEAPENFLMSLLILKIFLFLIISSNESFLFAFKSAFASSSSS